MNNTIFLPLLLIYLHRTQACHVNSYRHHSHKKYRPAILLRKAWHEGKNACRAILADLSGCLEYLVEALRTLLKGVLSSKTILMISESAESRKRENKSPENMLPVM